MTVRAQVEAAYISRCPDDFLTFVRGLVIPSADGPALFNDCMADFQREFFAAAAPSLHAVRDGAMPPQKRFWLERTKKASKDSDLACCLIWLLAFARIPRYFQVGAADRDQAAIVKRRIADIIYYNPWLNDYIVVTQNKVTSTSGLATLEILAADVAGSHGETPHMLVINELSHVKKWEFIENLMDNATGVPRCVVMAATNAGFHGTKPEVWRNNAIQNGWVTSMWSRPAPWLSEDDLADAKRRNPTSRFNRLYWGKWVSGRGDALDEEDIDACFNHQGVTGPVKSMDEGKKVRKHRCLAGLDLGVSHDHSALAVVAVNEEKQYVRLLHFRAWEPNPKTGEVDLTAVEAGCFAICKQFHVEWFGYDPTQAKLMAQRLARARLPMHEVSFSSPKNLTEMANSLVQLVSGRMLRLYDDEDGRLRRDLGKMSVVERGIKNLKLEAVSDEYGHADVGTALVITLPRAVAILGRVPTLRPDDELMSLDEGEITQERIDELPEELRDIYDAEDGMEDDWGRDE